jgi:hypothetical protein
MAENHVAAEAPNNSTEVVAAKSNISQTRQSDHGQSNDTTTAPAKAASDLAESKVSKATVITDQVANLQAQVNELTSKLEKKREKREKT